MYNDILVPTDGSQGAKAALKHGIEIASQWDATLHVLYVVDTRLARSGPLLETLRDEGHRAVRDVEMAGTQAGLTVVTEIAEGTPHGEILEYVSEHDIDMVIMGTHGRTDIDRVVVGSVAERVVRRSSVPVLTVRGDVRDWLLARFRFLRLNVSNPITPITNTAPSVRSIMIRSRLLFGSGWRILRR